MYLRAGEGNYGLSYSSDDDLSSFAVKAECQIARSG